VVTLCPLHIGFDGQIQRRQRLGGIRRYFADLASRLDQPDIRLSLPTSISEKFRLHAAWWQADVLHATFYGGFPYRLGKDQVLVSSLFDMTPERYPEHFFLSGFRSPHANKAAWLSASDLVIAISYSSADDLSCYLPAIRTPIDIIHLGTSIHEVIPRQFLELVGRRFWLMVGKRHAYKNGMTLLRALALLNRRVSYSLDDPLLVFAGGGTWQPSELQWITANGLDSSVLQLSVDDATLAWLYRHAEAVFVPSLAEGFSLPLIEALVCDAPVVASDLEVHREVGRDFATFLSPLNASSWADCLHAFSATPPQKPSEKLESREYARLVHYYSLERMVAQHVDSYRGVARSC
jgi:glycosyltransferase involved in cell wall biosynthesis